MNQANQRELSKDSPSLTKKRTLKNESRKKQLQLIGVKTLCVLKFSIIRLHTKIVQIISMNRVQSFEYNLHHV